MAKGKKAVRKSPQPAGAFDYGDMPKGDRQIAEKVVTEVNATLRNMTTDAIKIGNNLLRALKVIPRGRWGEWLKTEFQCTERTAQNYMQAARAFSEESETVSVLPPTAVYQLAAKSVPDEVRTGVIERLKAGETVTPDEVKARVTEARKSQPASKTRTTPADQSIREPAQLRPVAEWIVAHIDDLDELIGLLESVGYCDLAGQIVEARDTQQSPKQPTETSGTSGAGGDDEEAHNGKDPKPLETSA